MTGILLAVLTLAVYGAALATNPDCCSPAKLYLYFLGVFFFDIYCHPYRTEVVEVYIAFIALAVLLVPFDRGPAHRQRNRWLLPSLQAQRAQHVVILVWTMSMVGVISLLCLVILVGSVDAYLAGLSIRMDTFRGLNWLVEGVNTLPALNAIYFGVGLLRRPSRSWWIGYIAHLLLTFGALNLLGSRRGILVAAVVLGCVYNYTRKRLSVTQLAAAGILALFFAAAYGVLRMDRALPTDFASLDLDQQDALGGQFQYSISPFEIIFGNVDVIPKHGATLLTGFTELVPRAFWPAKPDTAGLVLTKGTPGRPLARDL